MAQYAVGNTDDALDIVQDAMLDFVRRYAHKGADEWTPLFFRVLQSRIVDAHRRQAVRNRFRSWLGRDEERESVDPLQVIADPGGVSPAEHLERKALGAALELAVRALPLRQRQAFLLRAWEGLDVAATAFVMRCSEGSVKTHYFRAVQSLRKKLEEFKP
jgi:RNA polymerase sigma-70 factor, ECF subfamily